jgi:hypothetical protein
VLDEHEGSFVTIAFELLEVMPKKADPGFHLPCDALYYFLVVLGTVDFVTYDDCEQSMF